MFLSVASLPASSPIRASEASLARTREGAAKPRGAEERSFLGPSLARSREASSARLNRRACSQAIVLRKPLLVSLQCRRILGGRNLDRVRDIVVAAIFDFMTLEDWEE